MTLCRVGWGWCYYQLCCPASLKLLLGLDLGLGLCGQNNQEKKRGQNSSSCEQDSTADGQNQVSKKDHAKKLCHRFNKIQ